jgi:hypothetical protein
MRKTMEKSVNRPGQLRLLATLTIAVLTVVVLAIPAGAPASGQELKPITRR